MSRRKSADERNLSNNAGKRPITSDTLKFSGALTCPSWLDPEAKREWRRIVKEFEATSLPLQSVDRGVLATYCQSYYRWMAAESLITKEGQVITVDILDRAGRKIGKRIVRNPATTVAKDERASMMQAAQRLGLDPTSRNKFSVPTDGDKEDPFVTFMAALTGASEGESEQQPARRPGSRDMEKLAGASDGELSGARVDEQADLQPKSA